MDTINNLENEIKALRLETKDLKPDNDNLVKKAEEANNNVNELLEENSKLKKEPQQLKDEFIPKIQELTNTCADLKEKSDKFARENEALKRDLDEIMDERKRRNADRRKRKEDQLKKIVDEAHKKLDEGKKKQDDKKNIIEAAELISSTKLAKEDLEKYPKLETKTTEPSHQMLEEDLPDLNIPDMPQIDRQMLDEPVTMYAGRPPRGETQGKATGAGSSFFEVAEPALAERAPFSQYAAELNVSNLAMPMENWEDEPLYTSNPTCPYGHVDTGYFGSGMDLHGEHPVEQDQSAIRAAIMKNAQEFLERAKRDPQLKALFDKQFPGFDVSQIIISEEYFDFALRLVELMKHYQTMRQGKEEPKEEKKVKALTEAQIRALIEKQIKLEFIISAKEPGKLKATIDKPEESIIFDKGLPEAVDAMLPLSKEPLASRGEITPEEIIELLIKDNYKAIQIILRKHKVPAPLPVSSGDDSPADIVSPSKVSQKKDAGEKVQIVREVSSKQKEDVNEFRKVESSGKVSWTKTHVIFVLDCSSKFFIIAVNRLYDGKKMEISRRWLLKMP